MARPTDSADSSARPGIVAPDRRALVGRSSELAWLEEGFASAAAGEARRLLVHGPAGIGSSALVDRFCATHREAVVVRVEADRVAGTVLDDLVAAARDVDAPTPDATPTALLDVLGGLQDRGPVILAIHDLHEVDDVSAAALARLLRRLHHDRVLVVATAQGDEPGSPWDRLFRREPGAASLRLDGLDRAGVDDLVRALRPGRWSRRVVARLHASTRGNPLYLTTMLRELPTEVLLGDSPLPAPRPLLDEVRTVVAGLTPPARAVLATLAVLDRPADLGLVERVTGSTDPAIESACEELAATGLVDDLRHGLRPSWRIHHPLVRTAVYAVLPRAERRARHLAAAGLAGGHAVVPSGEAVSFRETLSHRVAAAEGTPDPDLAADLEASAAAEPVDDADAATTLLQAADLSVSGDDAERRLLAGAIRLVEAYDTERLRALSSRIRAARPGPERDVVLGFLLSVENRADAHRHLREAAANPDAPCEVRALAAVRLALEHVFRGRGAPAEEAASTAATLSARPDRQEQALMLAALGRAIDRGPDAGLAMLDGRVDDALTAEPAILAGTLHLAAGDALRARDRLVEGIRRAERGAATISMHRAHVHLADAWFGLGRWDLAEARAEIALTWFVDGERTWAEATAHAVAALVPAMRGDTVRAERHLDEARASLEQTFSPQGRHAVARAEAVLARAAGEPARALPATTRLAEAARGGGMTSGPFAPWRLLHVEALLGAGDVDAARHALGTDPHTDAPFPVVLDRHRLAGLLAEARDAPDVAETHYREGLALADDPAVAVAEAGRFELAELESALGTLLGPGGPGQELLARARARFVELGATPWVERLDALPHSPSARCHPGAPEARALTPRERQVAGLVAQGMTSREVATALWVTPKAVDFHLGNVYPKLGFRSRRELRGRTFA